MHKGTGLERADLSKEIRATYGVTPPDAFVRDLWGFVEAPHTSTWVARRLTTDAAVRQLLRTRYDWDAPPAYVQALCAFVVRLQALRSAE